jgi:pseudouridine synthase
VPRTYRVELRRPPADRELESLRHGVRLDDGRTTPAVVRRSGERRIEITIHEGRKRQVRRMAEAVGNEVLALKRVRFGSLVLGGLRPGEARRLTDEEVGRLWEDAGLPPEPQLDDGSSH